MKFHTVHVWYLPVLCLSGETSHNSFSLALLKIGRIVFFSRVIRRFHRLPSPLFFRSQFRVAEEARHSRRAPPANDDSGLVFALSPSFYTEVTTREATRPLLTPQTPRQLATARDTRSYCVAHTRRIYTTFFPSCRQTVRTFATTNLLYLLEQSSRLVVGRILLMGKINKSLAARNDLIWWNESQFALIADLINVSIIFLFFLFFVFLTVGFNFTYVYYFDTVKSENHHLSVKICMYGFKFLWIVKLNYVEKALLNVF